MCIKIVVCTISIVSKCYVINSSLWFLFLSPWKFRAPSQAVNSFFSRLVVCLGFFIKNLKTTKIYLIEVNRKVQGVTQSPTAANLRHKEEEQKDKNQRVQSKQTHPREAHTPALSSPGEVIAMLKRLKNKTHKKSLDPDQAPQTVASVSK